MIGQKLKLRYLEPRKWCDKSEVLIHAMFEVLCRFIEDENKWIKIIDWKADSEHLHAKKEFGFLYTWWKKRQNRDKQDPLNKYKGPHPSFESKPYIKNGKESKEYQQLVLTNKSKKWEKAVKDSTIWENKCREEDDEMMHRLIKVRHFLWT